MKKMHLLNLYLLNSGHSNSKHQGRISARNGRPENYEEQQKTTLSCHSGLNSKWLLSASENRPSISFNDLTLYITGILNSLYELHLPVLSADCIDSEG
jgi:hypothetical protein